MANKTFPIYKISSLSLAIGVALIAPQSALALDSRCTVPWVTQCIGGTLTTTGQAQDAFLMGSSSYGLIVKNFDYLVAKRAAAGTDANSWGGAWTMGVGVYGHMSATPDYTSQYEGYSGFLVKNVKITGSTSESQIAGILHYNAMSAPNSHTDTANIVDVNIDVANTRVEKLDTSIVSNLFKNRVFGVLQENEGNNKNSKLNVLGNSTINITRACAFGADCDSGDEGWDSVGIRVTSLSNGHAELNVGENVLVTTHGDRAHGINAAIGTGGYNATINNAATITTEGTWAKGAYMNNWKNQVGNTATVTNTGFIQTLGNYSHGVEVFGFQKNNIDNNGGIYTYGQDASALLIEYRTIFSSLANITNGNTTINLGSNSELYGGYGNKGAGIYLAQGGGSHTINNAGTIAGDNFRSIKVTTNGSSGDVTINNTGTIFGFQEIAAPVTTVNNLGDGVFSLENFVNGEPGVVTSRFSNNNTGKFINSGTINFSDNMSNLQPVIAVLNGLDTFHLQFGGVIDMASNNKPNKSTGIGANNYAGDRLTITNDSQSSMFYSDGGTVQLNTNFTTANQALEDNRISDRLIVDNAMKISSSAAPTWIKIVPTKNSLTGAQLTTGTGFKVVEVKKTSTNDAFALAAPVAVGAKQYVLQQSGNKDWYLTSAVAGINSASAQLYNPSVGSYLANQAAMLDMTSLSLADRNGLASDSPTSKNEYGSSLQYNMTTGAVRPAFWMQKTNGTSTSSMASSLNMKNNAQLLRMGGDISSMKKFSGDLHVGWFGSTGTSSNSAVNRYTGTTAKGSMEGHAVGLAGTWYKNERSGQGLYVDSWMQFGNFKNTISGAAQNNREESYRSSIFSSSVETGYAMALSDEANGWMLTPQAQITHHQLKTDRHQDGNMLTVDNGNTQGVITRVGVRLDMAQNTAAKTARTFHPYLEANWVSDGVKNQLAFNNETLADNRSRDVVETKLGFKGDLSDSLKLWGHASNRLGENTPGVDKYTVNTGLSYTW